MTEKDLREEVEYLADLFINSDESFVDTCIRYHINPEAITEDFYYVLGNINPTKYFELLKKYKQVDEFAETEEFIGRMNR